MESKNEWDWWLVCLEKSLFQIQKHYQAQFMHIHAKGMDMNLKSVTDLIVYDENLTQLLKNIMVVQDDECRKNCFSEVSCGSWDKWIMKKRKESLKKSENRTTAETN